ncbi:MAG TPA: alpha/beta hydrolase [Pseudonocardiaceae bacterium]|jgi:pimeloyl-ACP methyl ester carboxylesterase|nr:alpha/beta hydrolase [Pseudonocardiaceae bacterium]
MTGIPVPELVTNDVDELKRYVAAHAESLGIPREHYLALFDRIRTDRVDRTGPGSWVHEWSAAARILEAEGKPLEASQHYNFARFPYVDGPARQRALDNAVRTVDRWRADVPGVERLDLSLLGGAVGCWTHGLSTVENKPLLLITGGIVSIKEQWAPVLLAAAGLGFAGVVTEMPGVGQNTLRYTPDSWRLLPALLDALADRAQVGHTVLMAMSFSGQLALRASVEDDRIAGIVTAGAPVRGVFTDPVWQAGLPKVTVDTLAHMASVSPAQLPAVLPGWALSDEQLAAVGVPVHYVASSRDEIIPRGDLDLLRAHLSELRVLEHDDVHGAPRHAAETRQWMVDAVHALAPS